MKSQNNQYFLKDKKARIYSVYTYQDAYGNHKEYYIEATPAPLWCYSKQTSQNLYYAASILDLVAEDRLFVFNNHDVIEVRSYIYYKNTWYQIERVDTTDDYNGDMFVYANITKRGNTPSADEIKPYGWQPS